MIARARACHGIPSSAVGSRKGSVVGSHSDSHTNRGSQASMNPDTPSRELSRLSETLALHLALKGRTEGMAVNHGYMSIGECATNTECMVNVLICFLLLLNLI